MQFPGNRMIPKTTQGGGVGAVKIPTSGKIGTLWTTHSKIAKSAILEWGTVGKGTVMTVAHSSPGLA